MSIKPDGNVGIGTNGPQAKLDVRGDVKLGSSGQLFAPGGEENVRILRGVVDQDGNIIAGSGFHVSHPDTGGYIITFYTPFAGSPAVTATSLIDPGVASIHIQIVEPPTASKVWFVTSDNDRGVIHNARFHFIAIGPR